MRTPPKLAKGSDHSLRLVVKPGALRVWTEERKSGRTVGLHSKVKGRSSLKLKVPVHVHSAEDASVRDLGEIQGNQGYPQKDALKPEGEGVECPFVVDRRPGAPGRPLRAIETTRRFVELPLRRQILGIPLMGRCPLGVCFGVSLQAAL